MHKLLQQDLSIMKLATVQGCLMCYAQGAKNGKYSVTGPFDNRKKYRFFFEKFILAFEASITIQKF